jgi:aminodeoxyfutalosine synthase
MECLISGWSGYGADDIDGTVVHELIYHDAGARTPEGMTVDQLHRLIREAGRIPVERDTLYRRVIRNGRDWTIGGPLRPEPALA